MTFGKARYRSPESRDMAMLEAAANWWRNPAADRDV